MISLLFCIFTHLNSYSSPVESGLCVQVHSCIIQISEVHGSGSQPTYHEVTVHDTQWPKDCMRPHKSEAVAFLLQQLPHNPTVSSLACNLTYFVYSLHNRPCYYSTAQNNSLGRICPILNILMKPSHLHSFCQPFCSFFHDVKLVWCTFL